MSNEQNNNKKNDNKKDNIIVEKKSEESDKSMDSEELDRDLDAEREKYLNNPQSFARKRDFFSFYSKNKNRKSAVTIQQKPTFNCRRINRLNSHVIGEKIDFKKFSKFELKPRGFGVNIKEKIELFEKKNLENQYKMLNLTSYQKTYYDNNELRKFNKDLIKIQNTNNIIVSSKDNQSKKYLKVVGNRFSLESNKNVQKEEKKKPDNKKLNLNLIVDYSKILNSSKIAQKEQKLDLFMTENNNDNDDNNNKEIISKVPEKDEIDESSDSSDSSDSLSSSKEVSTNLSHGMVMEKPIVIHNRQKSEICYYKDLLNKMSESTKKISQIPNLKDESYLSHYSPKKKNKYIVVKTSDNKINLEKQNKLKNGIKKIYSEKIPDNMTLQKLDNAKYRLNKANNNKIIKRQIFDILDKLIIDKNNKKKVKFNLEKINNLYDKQKLIRAFEIIPQLSLIHQKINILLQNNENSSEIKDKDNLNEKEIKQAVSSIYFLDCIGLEPIILFNGQKNIGNIKIINDINENIDISNLNNKKKYLKNYFQNLNKANVFLEILINIINHLQDTVNIPIKK